MILKDLFKISKNQLEGSETHPTEEITVKSVEMVVCPACGKENKKSDVEVNYFCCPDCGHCFKMSARKHIEMLVDEGSFMEHGRDIVSDNPISFPGYEDKLKAAREKSGEMEAVICGSALIDGITCCIFAMEADFMMGSMGTVAGDKIAALFEFATEHALPVIGIAVSGGARMQEGMYSLIQMAKVSGAVKRHSDAGNFYLSLLTHPTTGGVTASFAMLGDVIIAEPDALIGFAGPRVIEQSLRQKLPDGFQKAESVLKCGFLDDIVPRAEQREYIAAMLKFHRRKETL